jgi:colicin import membrane protein
VYLGLLVSVLMHAGLLGWTVISIQSTPELRSPMIEPVAVDMITPSELTRLTKGSREATLKEARPKESQQADPAPKEGPRPRPITAAPPPPPPPEPPAQAPDSPPPPKVAAATPPPPPPPPAVEPSKPEPDKAALEQKLADLAALQKVEEAKLQAEAKAKAEAKAQADAAAKAKAEAEAKAKAEAEAKAKAEADAKAKAAADAKAKRDAKKKQDDKLKAAAKERERLAAAKAKSELDLNKLEKALRDLSPDKRAPAPPAPETKSETHAKGPVRGAPEGRDSELSASARAMLGQLMRESVKRCWNINAGLDGIDKISVRIEIRLARNGSLADNPKILSSGSGPLFRDMADSALRAIVACAPYALPPDMYEGGWDHMIMNFDPSQMF